MDPQTPPTTSSSKVSQQPPRRWLWISIVFASLVIVGAIIAAVIMAQNSDAPSEATVRSAQTTGEVTISASGLSPATITIKKGQSITWTNQDTQVHALVSSEGQGVIDSEDPLNPGDTYSVSFTNSGTYNYSDGSGSEIFTGTIIVE